MRFSKSAFTALALAVAVAFVATTADARVGRSGFGGVGSRGVNTFTKPPVTNTAPNTAAPIQRSVTQPSAGPAAAAPAATGGFLGRPGFMGGLFTGLLGAGLLGMLFGGGFFGGVSGLGGLLGLALQATVIFFVVRWLFGYFSRRQAPAYAAAGGPTPPRPETGFAYRGLGGATGGGAATTPIEVSAADLDAFEERLVGIQTAFGQEDIGALRGLMTPEMVSEISDELAANAGRGLVNRVEDVKLLQGDVAEAWREGRDEYATLAMRFSLKDRLVERDSGRLVEERPSEATEVWTFRRSDGGRWLLSAIQQT